MSHKNTPFEKTNLNKQAWQPKMVEFLALEKIQSKNKIKKNKKKCEKK